MQRLSVWFVGAALAAGVLLTTGCPLPAGHPIDVAPGYVAEYTALAASSPYALAASSGDGRVFYTEKNTGSIRVVKRRRGAGHPVRPRFPSTTPVTGGSSASRCTPPSRRTGAFMSVTPVPTLATPPTTPTR